MMKVTFQGDPIQVEGMQPKVGDKAPDATLTTRQNKKTQLSKYFGDQTIVISVVPDVMTRTCELQTKRFAEELAKKDVLFLTVSANTPEEFNEWNEDHDLDLTTLSDTDKEFAEKYGLKINLGGNERLTRSVFIIDSNSVVKYVQIVEEIVDEPNYDEVLTTLDNL